MSGYISNQRKMEERRSNIAMGLIMFIIFSLLILFFIYKGNETDKEILKESTIEMQTECARHCIDYGITSNDLNGQKLEYENVSHYTWEYIVSWHSNNPNVTFKIHSYTVPQGKARIDYQWITPNGLTEYSHNLVDKK